MSTISEEEENYVRMSLLLTGISPRAVRALFDREFPPSYLPSALNRRNNTLLSLQKRRVINQAQWDLLFPRLRVADSRTFDVTLMMCLIRHLSYITTPCNGFDCLPSQGEITPGADMARIKFYRNYMVSLDVNKIDNSEFTVIWDEISNAIGRLGGRSMFQECEDLKSKILDKRQFDSTQALLEEMKNELENKDKEIEALKARLSPTAQLYSPNKAHLSNIRGIQVPTEIRKLDDKSVELYLKTLESGIEKKRDIRVIIVGKKGAGKTYLVKRLFGENTTDVSSTNGIEIHRRRCRLRTKDGRWIKNEGAVDLNDVNKRLLSSMTKSLQINNENKSSMSESAAFDRTDTAEIPNQTDSEIITTESTDDPSTEINTFEHDVAQPTEVAMQELQEILKCKLDLDDEEYATLTLWDFAGDKEFYDTHQTFLSPDAIYLVVVNLSDINQEESKVAFKFWFDSIHCYGTLKDQTDSDNCDPPVIVVGTHTDKFKEGVNCNEVIMKHIDRLFKEGKSHLQCYRYHLVSNTTDDDLVFELLKQDILKAAKSSKKWNSDYPAKFIQLEKALEIQRASDKQIMTFTMIQEICINMPKPITDHSELNLFLRQQHELGNVVYFEDIPNCIVLDPQWLADAFKCIITAEIFQLDLLCYHEWIEFKENGKLYNNLIDAIFKTQPPQIKEHQQDVLNIMENFSMIIKPKSYEGATVRKESFFYVPCKIMSKPEEDIDKMLGVTNEMKSTCICYVFSYLPPHLVNHIIVSCSKKYKVAMVKGKRPAFFHGIAVFDVSESRCTKLLVAELDRVIQFQIWEWNKQRPRDLSDIYEFIRKEIRELVVTRYKMTNIEVKEKWKCCNTNYDFFGGFQDFGIFKEGDKYCCEEHSEIHEYKNDWFKTPDVTEFNQQQINFARMCMVVLDLLTDVLYDRLKIDKRSVQHRDSCDTTFLYAEHRKLNIHVPTKGWGGQWKDIDPNALKIGDDIERIRLIRNEMQHAKSFLLEEKRYIELCDMIMDLLTRFDQHNKPSGKSYVNRFTEIRKTELKKYQIEDNLARFVADKERTQIVVAENVYFAETINVNYK